MSTVEGMIVPPAWMGLSAPKAVTVSVDVVTEIRAVPPNVMMAFRTG